MTPHGRQLDVIRSRSTEDAIHKIAAWLFDLQIQLDLVSSIINKQEKESEKQDGPS